MTDVSLLRAPLAIRSNLVLVFRYRTLQRYHQYFVFWATLVLCAVWVNSADAVVLWSHPETILVRDNGKGEDILRGAIKPQNSNSVGTLYFRFQADPLSDTAAKVINNFEAGFMLVGNGQEHLGIGNAEGAMAYSAIHVPKAPKGFQDLNSAKPDGAFTYEYLRAGSPKYFVFKIEYVPGQDARITAWLDPDLSMGATEFNQSTNTAVHFEANATFDEFRLIHRGFGGGWKFSQMLVGTSFEDLLMPRFWQRAWFLWTSITVALIVAVGTARLVERRRGERRIRILERERAVAAERQRIAQDIHDQVGYSLTKIGKLTEMMKHSGASAAQQQGLVTDISEATRETIQAMDEIVWAINPKNDTLKDVADYLVFFAKDFLGPTNIARSLDIPLNLPDVHLPVEVRHNLFMAVKEALNNAVKHAGCSEIKLRLQLADKGLLVIEISDNGRGFEPARVTNSGDGLGNMQRRMEEIGGEFVLASDPGKGTNIRLQLPLQRDKDEAR
jgi:signal transduction histidine kinase